MPKNIKDNIFALGFTTAIVFVLIMPYVVAQKFIRKSNRVRKIIVLLTTIWAAAIVLATLYFFLKAMSLFV